MKSIINTFALSILFSFTAQAQNVFVVNSLDDQVDFFPGNGVCMTVQGVCTFRAAIHEANTLPNGATPDVIVFDDIPVTFGIAQIEIIFGLLPSITEAVIIDADTAPGEVRIDGTGLYVSNSGNGTKIRGLTIGNFTTSGIRIDADDTVIENNYIGITRLGANYGCGDTGIDILFGDNNRIGGVDKGNVIGNCEYYGIDIWVGEGNIIRGNYIGTTPDGRHAPIPYAIDLYDTPNTVIGGPTRAYGNTIGLAYRGITTSATQDGLKIRNNYIGTNESGDDLGNEVGLSISGSNILIGGDQEFGNVIGYNDIGIKLLGQSSKIKGNYIGTNESGEDIGNIQGVVVLGGNENQIGYASDAVIPLDAEKANIIAFNEQEGISIEELVLGNPLNQVTYVPEENTVRGNQIYQNGTSGIDLVGEIGPDLNDTDDSDSSSNNLLNYPDIQRVDYNGSFDAIGIEYSVSSDPAIVSYPLTVDFYLSDDPVSGEGKTFVGSDTYATQNNVQLFDIDATSITWASTDVLVLTTTDADGNTSEFSPASNEIGGPGYTVSSAFDSGRHVLDEQSRDLPGSVALIGNYPNPFRAQTTITYELAEEMGVALTIFDVNGQLIHEHVFKNQAAGIHEILFDGSELSSGVYFYRVRTDAGQKTGKMLLMR